jgi:hypothetical protein
MTRRSFIGALVAAVLPVRRLGVLDALEQVRGWRNFGSGSPVMLHGRERVLKLSDLLKLDNLVINR